MKSPADGFTREEKLLMQQLNDATLEQIYQRLPTNRMKAIAAMYFELHYKQELIASIFNTSQSLISQEINWIKKLLTNQPDRSRTGKPYQPRRERVTVSIHHVLEMVEMLTR